MSDADGPLPFSQAFDLGKLIQVGTDLLSTRTLPLVVGSTLLLFLDLCSGGGGQMNLPMNPSSGGDGEEAPADLDGALRALEGMMDQVDTSALLLMVLGAVGCGLVLTVILWLVKSWLWAGWLKMHEDLIVKGDSGIPVLFSGGDRMVPLALWTLLAATLRFGVFVVAATPGVAIVLLGLGDGLQGGMNGLRDALFDEGTLLTLALGLTVSLLGSVVAWLYVEPGLVFGERAVAIGGLGPLDALEHSWDLADGNRISILVFGLVAGLIYGTGWMLCCVGMVPARAVVSPAFTLGWMRATRNDRASWANRAAAT